MWSLGRDPSHVLAIQGARFGVGSWARWVPHTKFLRQARGGAAPRGAGRRRAERRRGGAVR